MIIKHYTPTKLAMHENEIDRDDDLKYEYN